MANSSKGLAQREKLHEAVAKYALYEAMKGEAIKYGQLLLEKEEQIEGSFSNGTVSPQVLERALSESAEIMAKLRGAHLIDHIEQKAVLTRHQTRLYDTLRGYVGDQSTQEKREPHH